MSGKRPRFKFEQVAEALRKSGGYHTAAAQLLGCDRSTVSKYVSRHPKLQEVIDETVENHLDIAESHLVTQIRRGNMTAIIFYLKTKGRERGYCERYEANVQGEVKGGVLVVPGMMTVEGWNELARGQQGGAE